MFDGAWRNRCRDYLCSQGLDDSEKIASILERLFFLSSSAESIPADTSPQLLSDALSSDLDALETGNFERCPESLLSEDSFKALFDHRCTNKTGYVREGPPLTNGVFNSDTDRFVHDYGLISRFHGSRKVLFGYPTYRWDRQWFPSNPSEAFCNLIPFFWNPKFRDAFVDKVADARTEALSSRRRHNDGTPAPNDQSVYSEKLIGWCSTVLAEALNRRGDHFINMPNSQDFYIRIQRLYAPLDPRKLELYVFATTSGLAIKEQFYGSASLELDPFRPMYFEMLRSCKGRVYYQLDPRTTWCSDKGLSRSPLPLSEHIKHFASFLRLPHIEISEADFHSPETRWRQVYTLVTSDKNVAFSSRSPLLKQISNGAIATPTHWRSTGRDPHRVIRYLYLQQLKSWQLIKRVDEALTEQESLDRASETITRWKRTFAQA